MGCQLVPMGLQAGASGLCLWPVCWLRGSGVTWVVWGAGIWLRTLVLSVRTILRPPTHSCLHLSAHPLPAPTRPCLRSSTTHPRLPASWRCLYSRAACTCPPAACTPFFPACSSPRGLPTQR